MKVPSIAKGLAVAMGFGAAAAVSAQVLLNPGSAGTMTANLVAGPAGTIAAWSSAGTADDLGNFTAQVDSAVTAGNTYGGNALTFWYRLTNVSPAPTAGAPLVSLGVPMPGSSPVVVDQVSAGGNLSNLGVNTGSAVAFFWSVNQITLGQASSWQAIETPFTAYYKGFVGAIDGTSEDVVALVPLIPEPSTYVGLFALGLAGFAAYRRFRA